MLVIHAHWQPPLSPAEQGSVLFWAEDSVSQPPAWQHGRMAQNPKPKGHPYCADIETLRSVLGQTGKDGDAILRLPATRTGPLPSPGLLHTWELDRESTPSLSPWIAHGQQLDPAAACLALLDLASHPREVEAQTHLVALG